MRIASFLLPLLLILTLCTCGRATNPANYRIHDIWVLKSLEGKAIAAGSRSIPMLEINLTRNEVMGNDGCNECTAPIIKPTTKKLSIGTLQRTEMACPDNKLPDRYAALLPTVKTYELQELNLLFYNASGEHIMTFLKVD